MDMKINMKWAYYMEFIFTIDIIHTYATFFTPFVLGQEMFVTPLVLRL